MGKYFNFFKTRAEYDAYMAKEKGSKNLSVFLCDEDDEVLYSPVLMEKRVIATFNVGAKSTPTKVLDREDAFTKVEIGDEEITPVEGGYKFPKPGVYEVKYTLSDEDTIKSNSFKACGAMVSVYVPDNVKNIESRAFNSCVSLSSVTIGDNIATIGDGSFGDCRALKEVRITAKTPPEIYEKTFDNIKSDGTLYIHKKSEGYDAWIQDKNKYLGKYGWRKEKM